MNKIDIKCIDCEHTSRYTGRCYSLPARTANKVRGKVFKSIPCTWENHKNNCNYFEGKG